MLSPSEPQLAAALEGMQARVQAAGVAGADGRRLELGPASLVVGRVCDDEPLVRTESTLARLAPDRIVRGLAAAGLLCGAERLVLAVDEEQPDLLSVLRRAASGGRVEIWPLAPRVPLDADCLLADLSAGAGREGSARALPEHALVLDATVLSDLALAVEGRPVLHRAVTVAGLVRRPAVVTAALGSSLQALVLACGGSPDASFACFHNGVLRGDLAATDQPIELHSRSVIVLPHDHPLVVRRGVPVADQLRRAASACVRCRVCTDCCSANLLGAPLQPHRVLQAIATTWSGSSLQPDAPLLGALLCRRCGICSSCCPSGLRPDVVLAAVADRLAGQGVSVVERPPRRLNDDRRGRRLSPARLVERLGLSPLARPASASRRGLIIPDQLRVAARGPGGSPRVPVVMVGAEVAAGDLLAVSAAGSSDLDGRAPTAGRVVAVDTDDGITIAVR